MSTSLSFPTKGAGLRGPWSALLSSCSISRLRVTAAHGGGRSTGRRRSSLSMLALLAVSLLTLLAFTPSHAMDLVAFAGIQGPLVAALGQLAALAPGVKALVGFIGFVVAFISLSALRNFGPVLFYLGMAIFGAVGLTIAGAIMGAVI